MLGSSRSSVGWSGNHIGARIWSTMITRMLGLACGAAARARPPRTDPDSSAPPAASDRATNARRFKRDGAPTGAQLDNCHARPSSGNRRRAECQRVAVRVGEPRDARARRRGPHTVGVLLERLVAPALEAVVAQ